ncbi:protein Jade-1 isoform X1 [Paramormyrops kingsleyae]|uniref:Jade family PHD finger 2 n=1 Tax=Paramormyrops kingsleyae TaxID=1676925 RepID=A0A3B3SFQ4_9TELE|nr:E3 ubiquitin-protein ligase Jade-2 isoform X1 [Paramormyrops kingsleyae]
MKVCVCPPPAHQGENSPLQMESEKKRRKYSTSSNESEANDGHVTSWSKCPKNMGSSSGWCRPEQKKPSEVFRTDFITAMKLPDSAQLSPDEFYVLSDPWRQEWEKGVQVPANLEAVPCAAVRLVPELNQGIVTTEGEQGAAATPAKPLSLYDLDDLDVFWLEMVNSEFREMALPELDEPTMERVIVELERRCEENMRLAIAAEEGLGIEYDEDVVCDVCRSPEGEDGNEMVFCDKCNVCVHQACYGILKVPRGSWLCRTCALGVQPKCLLCPKRGGALKPTRSGTKWVHVSCALWIPEVSIGCPEKMEPITKVSHIPQSRWALSCSLCREHTGTCIQCSMPTCVVAFHVTCAFDCGLEMRTILAENDEVRFKSYCAEHSAIQGGRPDRAEQAEPEIAGQRKRKLQELEDEFYRLVEPADVAEGLRLSHTHVDFLYQYWKLRRRSGFNRPLLALKQDEVDDLAQQEQDVLYRRLKLFTHLRQDLERVRNLCYMVTRREKMKLSLCDLQEKILQLQLRLLEEAPAAGERGRQNGVKDRGKDRRRGSPEKKERWKAESGSLLKHLGLADGFPLDEALSGGWLTRSVEITADDVLSRWALAGGPRDGPAGLLSDQLLQGEESLLSLMMDPSLKSAWKTPRLGRGTKGKPRSRAHRPRAPDGDGVRPDGRGANGFGRPRASKGLHRRHRQLYARPKGGRPPRTGPQPPVSKMSSCHISEDCGTWDGSHLREACTAAAGPGKPRATDRPRPTLRLRLPRPGKPPSRGGPQDQPWSQRELAGRDGSLSDGRPDESMSDAEPSDSESPAGAGKLRLAQLHAGSEDVLRRSVLAT